MEVLAEIEITSIWSILRKWELEPPFVLSPRGQVPSAGPWVHMTCDFSRISDNMGENLLLLTNPNLGGRYQSNDFLDWTGTRGANLTQIEPWSLQ